MKRKLEDSILYSVSDSSNLAKKSNINVHLQNTYSHQQVQQIEKIEQYYKDTYCNKKRQRDEVDTVEDNNSFSKRIKSNHISHVTHQTTINIETCLDRSQNKEISQNKSKELKELEELEALEKWIKYQYETYIDPNFESSEDSFTISNNQINYYIY